MHGVEVDAETRCAHYRTPQDVVAVRFPCCGRFYACHDCHVELEDHEPRPWPRGEFERRAVLCGSCGIRLKVAEYLASPDACPHCGAAFNPRCVDHHPRYFEVPGDGSPRVDQPPGRPRACRGS